VATIILDQDPNNLDDFYADTVTPGSNSIFGGEKNDTIEGRGGNDSLYGEKDDDVRALRIRCDACEWQECEKEEE